MPSAQVIDLSPTPNKAGSDFGRNFAQGFVENKNRISDDELFEALNLQNEPDPIVALEKLTKGDKGMTPEYKKNRAKELTDLADLKRQEAQQKAQTEYYQKQMEKAEGEEKIKYLDTLYGAPLRAAQKALNEARKDPSQRDYIPGLENQVNQHYNAWNKAVRENAPKGLDLGPIGASEQATTAQPNQQLSAQPAAPQKSKVKVTPDILDAVVDRIKQDYAGNPKETARQIRKAVEEANPDEVPAKVERLVQEKIKSKKLPPKPEEIKQLKDKDAAIKKQNAVIDKRITKSIEGINNDKIRLQYEPDEIIDDIMKLYGLSEEEAMGALAQEIDFKNVPEVEQQELFEYYENWSDTPREALVQTIKDLMYLNRQNYRDKINARYNHVKRS